MGGVIPHICDCPNCTSIQETATTVSPKVVTPLEAKTKNTALGTLMQFVQDWIIPKSWNPLDRSVKVE